MSNLNLSQALAAASGGGLTEAQVTEELVRELRAIPTGDRGAAQATIREVVQEIAGVTLPGPVTNQVYFVLVGAGGG